LKKLRGLFGVQTIKAVLVSGEFHKKIPDMVYNVNELKGVFSADSD
jgi:hypothetical protein